MAMKDALGRMERRRPDARRSHLHASHLHALGGRATVPAHQRRQPSRPVRTTLTIGPTGLPHPATWASLPDTGAWTVARNCTIAQVRYTLYTNSAALSAVRFLLIHYRNLDIYDSTWSAPPPSLFVNMSRVYSVNTVNRLTGLFTHG